MELDTWAHGCKVRAFPWIGGKHIYMNVQYYKPGSRLSDPTWDRSLLITDNPEGNYALTNLLDSVVVAVERMELPSLEGSLPIITFNRSEKGFEEGKFQESCEKEKQDWMEAE